VGLKVSLSIFIYINIYKLQMQKSSKLFRLLPRDCVFFECDIQEKFIPHIKNSQTVVHNARRMALTAKIFKIPIISTK
jgi:hypothetical protein